MPNGFIFVHRPQPADEVERCLVGVECLVALRILA